MTPGSPPTVTVIVPTFNRSRYLGAAIDSILAQSIRPTEIIIVDDGSTDATPAIARSYGRSIRYLRKENGGKSTALNFGLQHATGGLIWIFDDDDIAAPEGLAFMIEGLSDPAIDFVHASYVTFRSDEYSGDGLLDMTARDVEQGGPALDSYGLQLGVMMRNFVMQPGMLVRRHCYTAVGPFDETLIRSQDYDMLLKLARRFRSRPVNKVVFYQRHHRGRRGSLDNPVGAGKVNQAWVAYDRIIFERIYESYALMEFLPCSPTRSAAGGDAITALLLRGCIMGRKQLWDHAASDFTRAAALAASLGRKRLTTPERDTMRQLLDIRNPEPATILDAGDFLRAVASVRSWRFREDIRAALLYPLPYVIRRSFKDRTLPETSRILRTYACIATPCSAIMAGFGKMKHKLG